MPQDGHKKNMNITCLQTMIILRNLNVVPYHV